MVTNLIYADDTTLLAGTKEECIELVEIVKRASEKAGLYLNVGKTKVFCLPFYDYRRHRRCGSRWEGYRGINEIHFLESADYQGRTKREGSAKKNSYGKSRNWRTNINMEGQRSNAGDEGETCESFGVSDCTIRTWTMRKNERRNIDAFELWCWRRVLRVVWMERKTNIRIIENIKPEWTLESMVTKAWARGESRRDER